MSEPVVRATRLSAGYGSRTVLYDVDFELPAGSITVLMGPNGSGKSTLLKALCKTLAPLGGTIAVAGRDIAGMPPREIAKTLAYVPQEEEPRFGFTVRQVVLMGRLAFSKGLFESEEDRSAADRAMRQTDCLDYAERPATEISGGERQRVLLARALAQETPILLMDEPMSHLDLAHALQLRKLLRALASEGKTIVLAMHDLHEALAVANQVALLRAGRIEFFGDPDSFVASNVLETVYQVPVERIRMPSGAWVVVPLDR